MLAQIILLYRRAYPNHCFYCGTEMMHGHKQPLPTKNIDHVVPRSKGGSNKAVNRVPCCHPCNTKKNNLPLDEFKKKHGGIPFFYETVVPKLLEFEQKGMFMPLTRPDSKSLGNRRFFIEILCGTTNGETNGEIAMRLGTTEQTIKNKWTVIKERLGAVNSTHAVATAIRCGIIKFKGEIAVPGDQEL